MICVFAAWLVIPVTIAELLVNNNTKLVLVIFLYLSKATVHKMRSDHLV